MPSSPALSHTSSPSASVAAPFLASIPDDPATYDYLFARLRSLAAAATPAWTTADLNLASTMTFGDFELATRTRRQLTAVSIAIHDIWPPYPTVNLHGTTGGLTRISLIQFYLDSKHEQILSLGSRDSPPASTPPAPAAPPPPPPLPTPAPAPAASKTPPSHLAAAPPPHNSARHAASPAYPPSSTYTSGAVRPVAQYCTPDRQYGGVDDKSLPRARATFTSFCEAFSVPLSLRAVCLPCALPLTQQNLPSLIQDNRGLP